MSFYFDGRVQSFDALADLRASVARSLREAGDCVVGRLSEDGCTIEVDFLTHLAELEELIEDASTDETWFAGPFPGRDDDGVDAMTITLPDEDGVVRARPH